MSSYMTSSSLIAAIKRKGNIPSSQVTFQDEDFLALANEELQIGILPSVMQFHEEFLVYAVTVPIVANQASYNIPERAIGNKLRSIYYRDPGNNMREMVRILADDVAFFYNGISNSIFTQYYLQNNSLILVNPFKQSTGTFLMAYYQRPNQLVVESRVAVVVSIDRNTGNIQLDKSPIDDNRIALFSTSTPLDLLEAGGGHKSLGIDVVPTGVNVGTKIITLDLADIPAELKAGDFIALSGECVVPQIPDELHTVLAQRVVARCLEALGDQAGLKAANMKIQEMDIKMGNIIDNRVESNPIKIMNKYSLLRDAKVRRRRNF